MIPEYIGTAPTAYVLHGYGVDAANMQGIAEITDESGKKRRTFSDLFGNAVRSILGSTAPESTVTQVGYNVLGQRLQVTDPRGLVTSYVLNTRGLETSHTSPDAGVVSSAYDKTRNLRFAQDANQATAMPSPRVYFTTYDFAARPLRSGQGAATFSSLNPDITEMIENDANCPTNCLVVRQYDAKPSTAVFPWNHFTAQITPALIMNNVAGRLAAVASKSNNAWQATLFSYDADGHVIRRYIFTEANGGASVLTAVNTSVTDSLDLRGAILRRADTVGTYSFYQWYDYNGRGLLAKMYASTTNPNAKPTVPDDTVTYRPSGFPEGYRFQGSLFVPIRYTIREQTQQIGDPVGQTYLFSARYAYQANGVVDTAEFYNGGSPAAQKHYRYAFGAGAYDALNRLKSADYSSFSSGAWTSTLAYDLAGIAYDSVGNLKALRRYRQDASLIDDLTYTISTTSNRLTALTDAVAAPSEDWDAETATAGTITYDANGNLTKWSAAPYLINTIWYTRYDLPDSLDRNGVVTKYRYDDAGQRITKQVAGGNAEVYLSDGATTLGVFGVNAAGGLTAAYFNLLWNGRVIGRHPVPPSSGTRTYDHLDALGSVRAVVSTTGAVQESYDYEPWGLLMPGRTLTTTTPTKEGFTGKEQDAETGLDYFGARYYMPALGRWMAVDPHAGNDPAFSPYVYVLNNPNALVDPVGLDPYVVDCTGDKDCQKHSTQFEAARQQALKSKDPDVQRAASAYGDPGVANGVVVKFAQPQDPNSQGETYLTVLPTGPNQGPQGQSNVTIAPTAAGKVEVVAHEGVHVANEQAFAATMSNDWSWWDQSKNLARYDDELSAFRVTNTVLLEANTTRGYPCGGSVCTLGKGVQNPDPVINRILADPNGPYKGVSATNKGPLIHAVSAPPSPTPP